MLEQNFSTEKIFQQQNIDILDQIILHCWAGRRVGQDTVLCIVACLPTSLATY